MVYFAVSVRVSTYTPPMGTGLRFSEFLRTYAKTAPCILRIMFWSFCAYACENFLVLLCIFVDSPMWRFCGRTLKRATPLLLRCQRIYVNENFLGILRTCAKTAARRTIKVGPHRRRASRGRIAGNPNVKCMTADSF